MTTKSKTKPAKKASKPKTAKAPKAPDRLPYDGGGDQTTETPENTPEPPIPVVSPDVGGPTGNPADAETDRGALIVLPFELGPLTGEGSLVGKIDPGTGWRNPTREESELIRRYLKQIEILEAGGELEEIHEELPPAPAPVGILARKNEAVPLVTVTPPTQKPQPPPRALPVVIPASKVVVVDQPSTVPQRVTKAPERPPFVIDEENKSPRFQLVRERLNVPANATEDEVLQAILDGNWKRNVIMLCPQFSHSNANVEFCKAALIRRMPWLGYHMEVDTIIQRARNLCARAFLESEAEWSFWIDGDVIVPWKAGHGRFYDKYRINKTAAPESFLNVNAPERLMSHKKTIVGGIYAQRMKNGLLVIQQEIKPSSPKDKATAKEIRRQGKPIDKIIPVDFVATGCALIHRRVYEDIMRKFPERAAKTKGQPYDFFGHEVGTGGEDMEFGRLAKAAGHQSFLDLGCPAIHVGNYFYWPWE